MTDSNPRDRVADAWHQFQLTAVSKNPTQQEVFAWAYMAGWAHDQWPAVADVVPPPMFWGQEELEDAQ